MNIIRKITFAAVAATLLFQIPTTLAGNSTKAVPPSNNFVILLEGTYHLPTAIPDLGLSLPDLNNGLYLTVPIYHIASGVPGPTDAVIGDFYVLGGENYAVYDLGRGALTAEFGIENPGDTVVTSDGADGILITGTYELEILEANGIYRSFAAGHIHMVDVLQITFDGLLVEHCFCYVSKEHGKP
jgi:hypothetical protein